MNTLTSLRPLLNVHTRSGSTTVLTPALSFLPISVDASSCVSRLHGSMSPGVGWVFGLASALADGPADGAGVGGTTSVLAGGGTTPIGTDGGAELDAPALVPLQAPTRRPRLRIAARRCFDVIEISFIDSGGGM